MDDKNNYKLINTAIVVPTLCRNKHLEKCLDSLTAQTLSDIEIICVNDCSTDNSIRVLQNYAHQDNRIKIIDLAQNAGAGHARNVGIDAATGEYIGFVDSDDCVDLDFYEKLYTKAKENNADVTKGLIIINNQGTIFAPDWQINGEHFINNPAKFIYGFTSAIYRTDLIKQNQIRFPEKVKNLEDPYFLIWVVAVAKVFRATDKVKYYYQMRETSATHVTSIEDFYAGAVKIIELINSLDIPKEHYLTVFDFIYDAILNAERQNQGDKKYSSALVGLSPYKKEIWSMQLKKVRPHFSTDNKG